MLTYRFNLAADRLGFAFSYQAILYSIAYGALVPVLTRLRVRRERPRFFVFPVSVYVLSCTRCLCEKQEVQWLNKVAFPDHSVQPDDMGRFQDDAL